MDDKKGTERMYDSIIIGSGFAGAVAARSLAEKGNRVLLLEKREHIGGNCYDRLDEHGVLVHVYGPHIFHTNESRVFEYLSRFTEWYEYSHEVVGDVYGKQIPIPFNLNTLNLVYGEKKGEELKKKLVSLYGMETRVPILELRKSEDADIKAIAEYVYENIFLKYTMKQWGQKPEEVDPEVTGRVPVLISYDNRYFQDKYQGMPLHGYTKIFENLLEHERIEVQLSVDAKERIQIRSNEGGERVLLYEGKEFNGEVIYTGALDEFFDCKHGRLPYRSLNFQTEFYEMEHYQSHGVINYTVTEDYTRITEYKHLTGQEVFGTTIMKEYPIPYEGKEGQIPYYAIINEENQDLYQKYKQELDGLTNFYLLGRLAEYKYFNIDAIVLRALQLTDHLVS